MEQAEITQALRNLARLCRESEKGFKVASENVHNRGLKALFRAFSQQRRQMAAELLAAAEHKDLSPGRSNNALAAFHRGWIHIKATMTVGPSNTERVVLAEAARGDRILLQAYDRVMDRGQMPETVLGHLRLHRYLLQGVSDQIDELRGRAGSRLVLRLLDSPQDVERAIEALQEAGFDRASIEIQPVSDIINAYQTLDRGRVRRETTLSGAMIGLLAGGLIAVLAALTSQFLPGSGLAAAGGSLETALLITVAGAGIGLILGAVMGAIIGLGIMEQDVYLHEDSVKHGHTLVMVRGSDNLCERASDIMYQASASAHSHSTQQAPAAA